MENSIELEVKKAVSGDKKVLETVIKSIQDLVYNLAIRMLWHPEDAKDASQEILIRVVTNLGKFNHKSSFSTWVYRVSANHCINYKNKIFKTKLNFEKHSEGLKQSLIEENTPFTHHIEKQLLVEEAKVGCSNAMLQCLKPESRLVYIIGEILEFNSKEGAEILDISPENFRKKLSRSRQTLHSYLNHNCGVVNSNNACRCHKQVHKSIQIKQIDPEKLLFTNHKKTETLIEFIGQMQDSAILYRTNAEYHAPEEVLDALKELISVSKFSYLN